ncbi:MAG: glutamate-5-semialdehyde dehydrogenase [Thermoleophilaceae bacterium]|jgi:glutamate-5-semialdehyde dehydrogenase|nr:glutamate-5-semialdehyde dehydrogenase [Thermoleophilaceae bacterium]MEA2406791.1 glutamate-5-semialdehyde dehydrogenase [Thermoleophilaceae bacterium]
MATAAQSVSAVCAQARIASRELATLDTATKNAALEAMADSLLQRSHEILDANARDMEAGEEAGLHSGLLDRLKLTEERVAGIAGDVRAIAALPDPVGETIEGHRLENGLDVRRVRVPLGVVAVVYEARPNVTVDCSALCLKSGNAIVLRGSSTAAHSNAVLAQVASSAVQWAGLPEGAISIVSGGDRDELRQLATQDGVVDLIIPRGGEGLKNALKEHATVPVLYASAGVCHLLVDSSADLDDAVAIAVNAKVQRPSVCNAIETLLVHSDVAGDYLPRVLHELRESGVELRVDGRTRTLAGDIAGSLADASEEDWATEYHALILSVKVVDSVEEGIEHVNRYGTGHSEAIVTGSTRSAQAFTNGVDAAAVYVNASTRFTDGAVFGMGAEIGNSTQKLHARGPIGLRELTTYKFVVEGSGQVRE